MNSHMIDQSPRHDVRPDSNSAKLARARAYLRDRNIDAVQPGNRFRYSKDKPTVLRYRGTA
jgi:hypothetical protein